MKNMPAVHEAIKDYAAKSENIESYTKYSMLVAENDQIFVQFDGVPKRGSLAVWIKLPEACKDTPWEPLGYVAYEDKEEPRTVAYLRSEIDDLDHNLNLAKKALQEEQWEGASGAPSHMLTFMKLTIANAEDLRRRLFKELDNLWE